MVLCPQENSCRDGEKLTYAREGIGLGVGWRRERNWNTSWLFALIGVPALDSDAVLSRFYFFCDITNYF